jgi:hypothetical protein
MRIYTAALIIILMFDQGIEHAMTLAAYAAMIWIVVSVGQLVYGAITAEMNKL